MSQFSHHLLRAGDEGEPGIGGSGSCHAAKRKCPTVWQSHVLGGEVLSSTRRPVPRE